MTSKLVRNILGVCAVVGSASLGFAQGSPNVVLLAHVNQYAGTGYSDCWGYTAPDGREYALEGVRSGTSIVDITDPGSPREVTFIPGPLSSWREIKTFQQYAYVVNESGGGVQIIDLSGLPASATLVATYTGFLTSHNIWTDEASATLYAEGNGAQPVRVLSLANPISPVQIASFGLECHDIFVQNDIAYISEGNRGSVGLYDVSNPAAATRIGTVTLPAPAGFAHNAWASADGRYVMTTEENTGETVKMFDVSDLGNVFLTDQYLGPSNLAHNVHMRGDFAYIAHYADGLRILDIADPANIFQIGFYDTNPANGGFNGAWGIYPFFRSGKIILSDMQNGLWVFYFDDGSLPPTITSTPGTSAQVGQPYAYDPDNKVDVLGTPPITFSFTGPAGFSVHPTTGTVTWTPTGSQVGTHAISITASNAFGSNVQNFTITVSQSSYVQRVNAGGPSYTVRNGNLFVADQPYAPGGFGFVGGTTASYTNPIGNTEEDPLYQDLRRSLGEAGSFEYRFDVPAGTYTVTLHLMAPAVGAGSFVMNVSAEGANVISNLNVNAQAGGTFRALIRSFTTTASDGTLNVGFIRVSKAALVSGIEVVQTSLTGR